MELIYSRIEKFRSFENQEICYSTKFRITYNDSKLKVKQGDTVQLYPAHIHNFNAIAGKNGAGKSNLCDYITTSVSKKPLNPDEKFFSLYYMGSNKFYVEGNSIDLIQGNLSSSLSIQNAPMFGLIGELIDGELKFDSYYEATETAVAMLMYRRNNLPIHFKNKSDIIVSHSKAIDRCILIRREVPAAERIQYLYNKLQSADPLFSAIQYNIKITIARNDSCINPDYAPLFADKDIETRLFKYLLQYALDKRFISDNDSRFRDYCNHVKQFKQRRFNAERMLDCLNLPRTRTKVIMNFLSKYRGSYSKFISEKQVFFKLTRKTTIEEVNSFINFVNLICPPKRADEEDPFCGFFDKFNCDPLTDGEYAMLEMFSSLNNYINRFSFISKTNFILVLDEPETNMHPEFCRCLISKLIQFFAGFKNRKFQIIISTHSPFILSDIPRNNIVLLENNDCKTCIKTTVPIQTFAQNIHTLLRNAFFLQSTIGEFAREKISEIFNWLESGSKDNEENYLQLIDLVGDSIIASRLRELYWEKCK